MTIFNVSFDVRPQATYLNYAQAKDDGGHPINYCYLFSGGTDPANPGVVSVSRSRDGNSTILVSCITTDPHYLIRRVKIYTDSRKQHEIATGSNQQFSWEIEPGFRSVAIYDRAGDFEVYADFYYTVMVNDTRNLGGVDPTLPINCDPVVHNITRRW